MEVRINKEIRDYKENLFFGLNTRQFFFSLLALAVSVGVYFLLRGVLREETVSWLCIVAAAPVAFLGFFHYQQMAAEQFLWAFFKSGFLFAGPRTFQAENLWELASIQAAQEKARKVKGRK